MMRKSMGIGGLLAIFVFGVVAEVDFISRKLDFGLSVATLTQGLLIIVLTAIVVTFRRKSPKMDLPPGPMALPIVGNWLQVGNSLKHRKLAEMSKTYGDVFMLKMGKKNLVIVSSPEAAKDVLHTQGVEFASRTRNAVFDIFAGKGQDMVFSNYGDHWRRMRRIMAVPFFTNKVVQHAHFAWEDEVDLVVKDLEARPESSTTGIVIRQRLQLMMYNIIYRMMFNSRFENEQDPLYLNLKALNGERCRLPAQNSKYNYADFIPILQPFLKGFLKICQEVRDKRLALFKERFVDERRKLVNEAGVTNIGDKCAIDYMLEAQKRGEITEGNVLYLIENINVAAIESTLMAIEWGIAELVNHPEVQKRIRNELDEVLGEGNLVSESDTHNNKLPFLTAVVKETLRLHMPIPLLVPHMNVKQAKLAGYDIPAESKILVNAWWIGNNPDLWDQPEKFMPERFLAAEFTEAKSIDFRFLPFGAGRRSCPGSVMAMPLMAIVLGRIVQKFDLLPSPGLTKVDVTEQGGQFSLHIATHSTVITRPRA
ncbi:hypothetical protein M758_4G138700 [Ceratodon purpureus]|nr:hypothetical protein M758_4G138700 [Ceratodon purpureus]